MNGELIVQLWMQKLPMQVSVQLEGKDLKELIRLIDNGFDKLNKEIRDLENDIEHLAEKEGQS